MDVEIQRVVGIAISITGCTGCGYYTYIAWFRPDIHRRNLKWLASFYSGWSSLGERWWQSSIAFWITRLTYPVGFLGFLYIFVSLLLRG
jgi:hypothetical protein